MFVGLISKRKVFNREQRISPNIEQESLDDATTLTVLKQRFIQRACCNLFTTKAPFPSPMCNCLSLKLSGTLLLTRESGETAVLLP